MWTLSSLFRFTPLPPDRPNNLIRKLPHCLSTTTGHCFGNCIVAEVANDVVLFHLCSINCVQFSVCPRNGALSFSPVFESVASMKYSINIDVHSHSIKCSGEENKRQGAAVLDGKPSELQGADIGCVTSHAWHFRGPCMIPWTPSQGIYRAPEKGQCTVLPNCAHFLLLISLQ